MIKTTLSYLRTSQLPFSKKIKAVNWLFKTNKTYSPYPLKAKIEISRRCNLNCRMCIRPHLPTYPDMEFADFKKILRQLPNLLVFSPHGYGEPLIHPQFLEFMQYVTQQKIRIHLVTNGTLLTHDLTQAFIETCKPLKITFSIDAGTKKLYEWIRRGANFETTIQNIRSTVEAKNKFKTNTRIVWYCTIAKYNYHEILEMVNLAEQTGMDAINFTDLTLHEFGLAKPDQSIRKQNLTSEVAETVKKLQRIYDIPITYRIAQPLESACKLPWLQTFIQVNGDVYPCTDTLDHKLGNIHESSFKEIWNNTKMRMFRNQFFSKKPFEECQKCVWHSD